MSSTNKTTNYLLPQFISTDKPTWLGDVNGAMSIIDSQMKSNADSASAAAATANAAATQAEMTVVSGKVTNLETAVEGIQTDLQKIRVYDGQFNTGTLAGNQRHSVTVTLPSNAVTVLAVIPYGFDPSNSWSTVIYFDGASADGTVSLHVNGATSQYYSIKYKVIYTVA